MEDLEEIEDFDVKKYKIAGDLSNPRISLMGQYHQPEPMEDEADDDWDELEEESRPTQPSGRFISNEELDRLLEGQFRRGMSAAKFIANHPMNTEQTSTPVTTAPAKKAWRTTISV